MRYFYANYSNKLKKKDGKINKRELESLVFYLYHSLSRMVVSKKNMHEVEKTLRYCRDNNLWVIFAFYLPVGRCARGDFDKSLMLTKDEKRKIRDVVRKVDEEYGFKHEIINNFLTSRCVEFMCIYGDGRVSPCPGNETIVGDVKTHSIKGLKKMLIEKFPVHNFKTFDGFCPYRERF